MISPVLLIAFFLKALEIAAGYIWGTAGVEWTEARQKQKVSYMVSKYGSNWKNDPEAKKDNYYSAAAFGAKWVGHIVYDCSGLFYAAFKSLGGYIYHGSNTIWLKYCTSKGELKNGKRDDGKELKPGTAVFTYNKKKDNRGHIGLYIGDGQVVEASGTINGVIISKITASKWVEWGELKGVDYGEPVVIPVEPTNKTALPTLKRGSKGDAVKIVQEKLIARGYSCGAYGVDGDFGQATEKAVKAFQKDHNLKVDGIVGTKTYEALDDVPVSYTVIIPNLSEAQADALVRQYPGSRKERG